MTITLSWQSIITASAVVSALALLLAWLFKLVRWVDKQKQQDKDINSIQEELQLLTWGMLACLKGLKEKGCNGPVTKAIKKIEKKLNEKAHHRREH